MLDRSVRMVVRVSPEQHRAWTAEAERTGLDLSNWVRLTLNTHLLDKIQEARSVSEEKATAKRAEQEERAKAKKAAQDEQANAAMLRKYTNMGLKVLGPDTGVRPPIVVDLDSVKLHEPTPRDLAYTRARLKLGRPPTNGEVEEELRGKTTSDLDDPTD